MGRPRKEEVDTEMATTETKKAFKYTPYVDSENLPKPELDKKGNFKKYAEPHYAYRRSGNNVEFIAIYRKPKGIIYKGVRTLKIKQAKNADDAFFRLIKANNIPEIE